MVVSTSRGVTQPRSWRCSPTGSCTPASSWPANLGVSRAAVWKGIERLRAVGIDIQALARRGYALAQAVELLDLRRIRAELRAGRAQAAAQLELLFEVDSTNTRLLEAPPPPPGSADAVLTELQNAGRGRRGRPLDRAFRRTSRCRWLGRFPRPGAICLP